MKEGETATTLGTTSATTTTTTTTMSSSGTSNAKSTTEEDPLVIDESNTSQTSNPTTSDAKRSASVTESDDDEKDFEPSVDMMVNDFDDERTLDEEEAAQDEDSQAAKDEVSALEAEGDIPLEELLKMYGYDAKSGVASNSTKAETNESNNDSNDNSKPRQASLPPPPPPAASSTTAGPPPAKKARSALAKLYEGENSTRALRSTADNELNEDENDEEDEEDDENDNNESKDSNDGGNENRDYSWKKTIMIGPSFQASVPCELAPYEGSVLPYENEDKLLWDPSAIKEDECERFLAKCQELVLRAAGVNGLPVGAHIRDDEQALHMLLQCGYNFDEALRRLRLNPLPQSESMSLWSEEECRAFELGLRLYGKDFHMIQQQKVRTRSVGELVQFYYLWKKTERHDVFANATRLEKKKYTLHPGTTDYMDRFIDEQDVSRERSSPPNYHTLLFGSLDSTTAKPGCPEEVDNPAIVPFGHNYDSANTNGNLFSVAESVASVSTTTTSTSGSAQLRTSQLFPAESQSLSGHATEASHVGGDT